MGWHHAHVECTSGTHLSVQSSRMVELVQCTSLDEGCDALYLRSRLKILNLNCSFRGCLWTRSAMPSEVSSCRSAVMPDSDLSLEVHQPVPMSINRFLPDVYMYNLSR